VVLAAGHGDSTQARAALEELCRTYWYPLYAFVRRQGHGPAEAQDLTQEFLARLLARQDLAAVDRAKGKFRSFLLASLTHFLANEWDKARARKRGGGQAPVSLDAETAEARYRLEPADTMSADRVFERRWALTLLDQVLERLRAEAVAEGKGQRFEALKAALVGDEAALPYARIAARLGLSEGAVKVAVHRLRQRYRELLRAEIANTVAGPEQVDEELRHLFQALSAS
jgi:RNA polymerase sigma-70 factor (ECF subfamily)